MNGLHLKRSGVISQVFAGKYDLGMVIIVQWKLEPNAAITKELTLIRVELTYWG